MVHTPRSRRACPAPAHAPRFQALCMALGLSDGCPPRRCTQPQPQKLRLPPAAGVHKGQQRCKLPAAAAAAATASAVELAVATPPRLAEQPRRRQPFAVGRPPRPVPAVWRTQHAAQQAQQAAWTTRSCDSVTSPNVGSGDCGADSRGVMSPAPLSTAAGAVPGGPSDAGAILAAGMRLILASMPQRDVCQLAAARNFLAGFPPTH